jgi:drug/metabolite transporter (DMT)-like permease
MEMLAGGAVLAGLTAVTGELNHLDPGQGSGRSVLALLYLTGPGSLLAMTCYVIALRRLPYPPTPTSTPSLPSRSAPCSSASA